MPRFDPRGRVNRALLVGVSTYDFTEPPHGVPGDLPAVEHNLDRLRDTLARGGVLGEDEITVARSPSLDAFERALRSAAEEAEGLLLLYFAGHGAIPSAGDELFLQMRNASVIAGGRAVFPGAEMFTTVLTWLASSPAERIVVILDCCFAGNAAWIWEHSRDKRRVLLLMSVQANHRTDAGDGGTPTPFTGELLHELDVPGELGFREVSDALRRRMAEARHETLRGRSGRRRAAPTTTRTCCCRRARTTPPARPAPHGRPGRRTAGAAGRPPRAAPARRTGPSGIPGARPRPAGRPAPPTRRRRAPRTARHRRPSRAPATRPGRCGPCAAWPRGPGSGAPPCSPSPPPASACTA
ncbi:hypothetical protein GCM10020295_40360 [Streptomyces cinereospinus]